MNEVRFDSWKSDVDTLQELVHVARSKTSKKFRALCCPTCGGDVLLDEGLLWCQDGQHVFKNLMELATR